MQKIGRIMLLSKCEVCDSKKSKFIKEQEDSGLLSKFLSNKLIQRIKCMI